MTSALFEANDSEIRANLRGVLERSGVRLAVLFGSRARGNARSDSDMDLAVLAPGVDRLELGASLSKICGTDVDVVSLSDLGIPLLEEVVRDGQPFYEATPGVFAQWRSHALIDLETDRPWFARMRDAWLNRVAREGL